MQIEIPTEAEVKECKRYLKMFLKTGKENSYYNYLVWCLKNKAPHMSEKSYNSLYEND
jgi:hypothetical protein